MLNSGFNKEALSIAWGIYFPKAGEHDPNDGRNHIVEMFIEFFQTTGEPMIRQWNRADKSIQSITFSYSDLTESCDLEDFIPCLNERPEDILACMGIALFVLRAEGLSGNEIPLMKLNPRIEGMLPVTPLAALKANIVGHLVTIAGTVVRVSGIKPLVTHCDFVCPRCGGVISKPFADGKFDPPINCVNSPPCKSKTFFPDRASATTVDYQKIKVQEIENDQGDPGRIPRSVEIELTDDLVDTCVPGDTVTITGIIKSINAEVHAGRSGKRAQANTLYLLYIEANSIQNCSKSTGSSSGEKLDSIYFNKQDLKNIREIAERDFVFDRLVYSLCPGIFGSEIVKAGLILGLFGGAKTKDAAISMAPRPDSHVLVVGDPGLGKSQMLRAVSMVAPRAVYICGNTTTTTGLTVTMVKDSSGDYGLEAGALVLADRGICCIDEFDKMGIDYQALLEAMEQQSISIAKAGIVANLSARTSVIAAANPVGGHYNRGKSVCENLKMKAALLSRFDLIFVLLDRPDEKKDQMLSAHVLRAHSSKQTRARPDKVRRINVGDELDEFSGSITDLYENEPLADRLERNSRLFVNDSIPHSIFKKYIAYAKKYVHPRLSVEAAKCLQDKYLEMRASAGDHLQGVPITTRQLQSLVRLAQARAKCELREIVTEKDAREVVEILQESLLDTLTDECGQLDFGRSGGMSLAKQVKAYVSKLKTVSQKKNTAMFTFQELLDVANSMGLKVDDFRDFVEILRNECYLLKKGPQQYKVQISSYSQVY